ncbi:MAG: chromosome segregation protein SMC [candidate division Zixibacteria bacterium]|nr:chromosome segregation protein SMC [candidate division Zixibacteria bacterium]
MRLSHVEIIGFKSFASKLDIKFSDGITAVVGPNGCGKSNVVDAIRWVLGEQRATSLRGERMEDIIFNGTATRKPLGMAEVSLTIDNAEQRLPIEYSEVTLTRRYFRSGESQYFLNKVPCRLKDITDLLLDTGMGTHAYSIIEQGMVDALVNGSPLERRHLIEEAAGINKYKTRRRLAERKLESTQQDLLRIADLLEEVERNASALRRQLWKYERFQRLTQDRKAIELAVVYYEYAGLREKGEPVREKLHALSQDKVALSGRVSTAETRIEGLQLELTEKERTLSERQHAVNDCDERIRALNERVLVARTRRNGLDARLETAQRECEQLKTDREQISIRRDRAQQELDGMAAALEQARGAFDEREAGARVFAGQLAGRREAVRTLQSRRLDLVQRLTEKRAETTALENLLDGLRHREHETEQQRTRLTDELKTLDERLKTARKELTNAVRRMEENRALKTEIDEQIGTLQHEREETRERQSSLDTQMAGKEREHGLLVRMQEQYEGYGQGVRALLLDGPRIEGLSGVLAGSVEVDPGYAPIIEAFMGDTLQYMIADNTERTREGIRYLSDRGEGAASFVALDRFAGRRSSPDALPSTDPGIVGRASDYVKTSKTLEPVVSYFLSHAVLVRDLDTALRLSPLFDDGRGWRLLSLTGEVVDPVGVITGGGAPAEDMHLLSRNVRIETLEAEMTTLRTERETLVVRLSDMVSRLNELLERRTVTDRLLGEQQTTYNGINQSVQQIEFQYKQCTEREKQLTDEIGQTQIRIAEAVERLKPDREALSRLAREREEAETTDREAQDDLAQIEAENQRLTHQAQEARVTLISLESRCNELRTTSESLSQQLERLTTAYEQRQQEIAQAGQQTGELNRTLEQGEEELKTLYADRREKELGRDAALNQHRTLQDEIRALQVEAQEVRKLLSVVQEQIHEQELQDAELYMRGQEIRRIMMNRYDADPEQMAEVPGIEGMETFDTGTAEALLEDVERKINELGPINMAAVEEYNAAKERLDFLTDQRDDLVEAKENLEKTIVKMNRAARARFLDTFEEVRHNFMKTFQALFEGGEADLLLDDGDPLEVGIEIMARPAGKRLQSIALMSGGETALTAIALLFAIYLVKPSPFCVFDEVDAPLDDANVRRFAAALRQFARDTQFLVVTHNKRTMEAADYLYGITMEDPGASKMVSVRLTGEPAGLFAPEPAVEGNGTGPIEESV